MVGAVAQLGEHLLCKQGVSGSIPLSSTNALWCRERAVEISFEEIKVCTWRYALCLFCIHCEEKIDLEASRYGVTPMSEPSPDDPCDGLAGRNLGKDWR